MNQKEIENKLLSLKKSKFRSSFHLKEVDKNYIAKKGMEKIKSHAYDFIQKRLAPKDILNDGKQTPTRGHPVFILNMLLPLAVEIVFFNGTILAKRKI